MKEYELILINMEKSFVDMCAGENTNLNQSRIIWSYLIQSKLDIKKSKAKQRIEWSKLLKTEIIEEFHEVMVLRFNEEKSLLVKLRTECGEDKVLSYKDILLQYDNCTGWCSKGALILEYIETLCLAEGLKHCLIESERGKKINMTVLRKSQLSKLVEQIGLVNKDANKLNSIMPMLDK